MRLGLEISATELTSTQILRLAKESEKRGVHSLWINEDIGRDAVSILGTLAATTSKLRLATGVINTYTRTPFLTAMTATTLQELTHGRHILGLSDAHTASNTNMHGIVFEPWGQAPARMREYLIVLTRLLAGEKVSWKGKYIQVPDAKMPLRPAKPVPIYINARMEEMLEIAGEFIAGAHISIATPQWIKGFALPHIKAGAAKKERRLSEVDVSYHPLLCLSEDHDKALKTARKRLSGYFDNPETIDLLKDYGFRKEATAIEEAKDKGRKQEPSDKLIEAIALVGSPETVGKRLRQYIDAGVKLPILRPQPIDNEGAYTATERALHNISKILA
ncbi:MAG: LLM class flavin-dependent oxidoreductase [Thaumarchaeota archaeon]|nr:LLM class flavin-dependent oxidoreductase [Nitrososphaerota archaeon]